MLKFFADKLYALDLLMQGHEKKGEFSPTGIKSLPNEKAGVAFVKGADEGNKVFEKINNQ